MEILFELAETNLETLLADCLEQTYGLQLKWKWDQQSLYGEQHDLYYVQIIKNEANSELLKQFIQEWNPVYEQLSFHHDYVNLRMTLALNHDGYNHITQQEEMLNDVLISSEELWMDSTRRGTIIDELDELIFEQKKVLKRQLHYIAINAKTTTELYTLIEQKMTQNDLFNNACSQQTLRTIKQNFQIIQKAIQLYNTTQQREIAYRLTTMLDEFYIWLKGLLTAIKGQLHRGFRRD